MRIAPLLIKNKTIEIGYKGHSRWGALACLIRPAVIGDFHIFLTYQARTNRPPRIGHTDRGKYYMNVNYVDCTVSSTGCIIPYRGRAVSVDSLLIHLTPDPPASFYADLTTWTFDTDLAFPMPRDAAPEAFQAAITYLKRMQTLLNAHILYWDTEGRPPLSMLSPKEVLEKYDTSSRRA